MSSAVITQERTRARRRTGRTARTPAPEGTAGATGTPGTATTPGTAGTVPAAAALGGRPAQDPVLVWSWAETAAMAGYGPGAALFL
ncbi:hypothetical protein [Streptomyces sp. NRRL S-340]|uniref:hypothetical protein n=1 Tax=Streptomyces sp. NRRL S-340 TaxID=1463901 RepID=UPI00055F8B23|nr:hypothetical protein [Streptomyces sp. NRRL S-340]